MIVKMSQKDSNEDIQKAYKLFVDESTNPRVISKNSLAKVVQDLEEDLTEQQIEQLIYGANNKSLEDKDLIKEELVVNEQQFIKIISRELNEEKKKGWSLWSYYHFHFHYPSTVFVSFHTSIKSIQL